MFFWWIVWTPNCQRMLECRLAKDQTNKWLQGHMCYSDASCQNVSVCLFQYMKNNKEKNVYEEWPELISIEGCLPKSAVWAPAVSQREGGFITSGQQGETQSSCLREKRLCVLENQSWDSKVIDFIQKARGTRPVPILQLKDWWTSEWGIFHSGSDVMREETTFFSFFHQNTLFCYYYFFLHAYLLVCAGKFSTCNSSRTCTAHFCRRSWSLIGAVKKK